MTEPSAKKTFPGAEVANLIQHISHLIDSGECSGNPYDFAEARRILNNQLPQLIDKWVAEERRQAFDLALHSQGVQEMQSLTAGGCEALSEEWGG